LEEHEATWKTNGMSNLKYTVLERKFLDDTKKASKVTTDVLLNDNHWANEKAGMDYVWTK
jgi:hypothetical protein